MSFILISYYLLITLGIGLAGVKWLKRFSIFSQLPVWTRALLTVAFFPTLVAWSGFAGLFRYIPFLAEGMGLAAAIYAVRRVWQERSAIVTYIRGCVQNPSQKLLAGIILLFLLTYCANHWCYIKGGSNNFPIDEIRGLSFTSALAANYLKPAHQINLSLPIRYGYNFFEYTAFLYSAVRGYSWPSLALFVGALGGISLFYISFIRFVRVLTQRPSYLLDFTAMALVSFWGMDAIIAPKISWDLRLIEFWNTIHQITQTSTLWNLLYHYLAATGLGLEAMVCLSRAVTQKRRDYLIAAAILLCTSITFAALAGMFFMAVGLLSLVYYVLFTYPQPHARWLVARIGDSLLLACLFVMLILLPNAFIWLGSQDYLSFHWKPVLWFSRKSMLTASYKHWQDFLEILWYEIGSIHVAALALSPVIAWKLRRNNMYATAIVASLISLTFVTLSMMEASTQDFFWRTGGLGVVILSSAMAVIACSHFADKLRSKITRAIYAAILLGVLSPGIYNFYAQQYFSYLSCYPARKSMATINSLVDLHSPVNSMPYSGMDIYFAGRVASHPNHNAWMYLSVHGLPKDFAKKWFTDGKEIELPCATTWYGQTTPNGYYADIVSDKYGMSVYYTKCPDQ